MPIVPYLIFNGNCEEALKFYETAFDGTIKNLSRYEGTPAEGAISDKQKVLHAHFEARDLFLMASDGDSKTSGGMVHLSLDFSDVDEMKKRFYALAEGGNVTMPLQDTFWGAVFGMLTDRFGIMWMFNHDKPGQGHE